MSPLSRRALFLALTISGVGPLAPVPRAADSLAPPGLQFAGLDWQVKASPGSVGPGPNVFAASGVHLDSRGRLHLGIVFDGLRWLSSEVVSRREFGYGDYEIAFRAPLDMDPNAVFGFFTWDPSASELHFLEVDFELSKWGSPSNANGLFVVQPAGNPLNLDGFELPAGLATVSFRWTPGRLFFRAAAGGKVVHQRLFTANVPAPGHAHVRLNLWRYHNASPANGKPVEVVIEGFRFLPLAKMRGD